MELIRSGGIIRFGAFELDRNSGELRKSGMKIHLREQPFRILAMLLERPGEIITREEIQKILWPNDTVVEFEHSINAAIKALRQALGDDADNPRFVETLPRRGYRFIAPVDGVVAPGGAPSVGDPTAVVGAVREPPLQVSCARYRLLEKLGAGGMGEVFRARDTKLNRDLALKFLPEDFTRDPKALERFKREAHLASSLNHPHICHIYDTGELDGRQFISMELVEGETLAARLAGTGHAAAHAVIPAPWSFPRKRESRGQAPTGIQPMPALDPRFRGGDDTGRSALPLNTVLDYGIEIAGALAAAHRLGIIHRDLKPQNIMLTKSGAKLLDFGLAKLTRSTGVPPMAFEKHGQAPTQSLGSPSRATVDTDLLTAQGAIMGTLHYMAPEQLEGKPADARSDIFAFGCVLYEMATGKRAFEGESSGQVLAAIMKNDPAPITAVGPNGVRPSTKGERLLEQSEQSPQEAERRSALQRVVKKCLAKDPDDRWQSAADLRDELKWIKEGEVVAAISDRRPDQKIGGTATAGPPLQRALPWVAGIVLGSILTGLIVGRILSPKATTPRPVTRFAITLPSGDQLANMAFPALALSPDGSELVYAAGHGDVNQLYPPSLNQMEAKPIADTEGASNPFFSPDGQWVGFFAGGNLKKVSIQGGPPITICSIPFFNGGASWGADNTIVFASTANSRLFQVSGAGGTPRPVTTVNFHQGEFAHHWPQVLPGGEVLSSVSLGGSWDHARVEIASLKTGERRVLVEGGTCPRYIAPGYVVYSHGGELVAVPFDLKQLKVTGPPAPVLESVRVDPTSGAAQFTLSENGSLAFVPGGAFLPLTTLVWVDRNGKEEPLAAPPRPYTSTHLSPDGRRVAIWIGHYGANSDVWVYDLTRRTFTRLTTDGDSSNPAWPPDGKRVVYSSVREQGRANLFWANPDGSGEERLTSSESAQVRPSFSPDGRFLAFIGVQRLTGHHDIQILPLEGNRKPQPFHQTQFHEDNPMFSPDGHWIAYVSNETGRNEVYLRPYPGPGEKLQVSTQGGEMPVWSRDGRELFYRSGNKMMAVAVSTGPALKLGEPHVLFEGDFSNWYDVAPDGRRFLMIKPQPSSPVTQINVVENWIEDLKHATSENVKP
ncbi:MAG TPA: protein kinase [Terriglobia bacterium]|nr:protein kinase [Terriglobia bacterium]